MKTKITYVLSCIMMLGIFATKVNAQESAAEARTTKILSEMTKVCNLTADQQTKMQSIILENQKQKEADWQAHKGDKDALKAAAKARNEKTKQEALTVVSQDQLDKWVTYKKQQRQAMMQKREAAENHSNQ
ncbi:MAG TPA: hypothetical protein VNG53_10235 [Bacteroidia bacterium]|nr:hypothetical protein [Bacteroidia bacterium]